MAWCYQQRGQQVAMYSDFPSLRTDCLVPSGNESGNKLANKSAPGFRYSNYWMLIRTSLEMAFLEMASLGVVISSSLAL